MNTADHITQPEWELIDAFLMNNLSLEQLNIFKEKSSTDPLWNEKINTVNLFKKGIGEAVLTEKMNAFHTQITAKNKPGFTSIFFNTKTYWVAAACILLMVAFGIFLLKNNKYERAYAHHYQPDSGLITAMGVSNHYTFDEAMVQYKNKKYQKALSMWLPLLQQHPSNDSLLYFTAAAYQNLENYPKAAANYLQVLKQHNSVFYKDASWYLGLIYIKNKQVQKAKPLLLQSGRSNALDALP